MRASPGVNGWLLLSYLPGLASRNFQYLPPDCVRLNILLSRLPHPYGQAPAPQLSRFSGINSHQIVRMSSSSTLRKLARAIDHSDNPDHGSEPLEVRMNSMLRYPVNEPRISRDQARAAHHSYRQMRSSRHPGVDLPYTAVKPRDADFHAKAEDAYKEYRDLTRAFHFGLTPAERQDTFTDHNLDIDDADMAANFRYHVQFFFSAERSQAMLAGRGSEHCETRHHKS
jgi:hypothetical protein